MQDGSSRDSTVLSTLGEGTRSAAATGLCAPSTDTAPGLSAGAPVDSVRAPFSSPQVVDTDAVKLLLVGDGGVGKSSILRRLTTDTFSRTYIATVNFAEVCSIVRLLVSLFLQFGSKISLAPLVFHPADLPLPRR